MESKNTVCRFCLKLMRDANMEVVNEVTQKILEVLLIKQDLELSEDPVICKMCSGILNEIYMFKSKCLYSENIVSAHFESNLKVNLRDVLIELENKPSIIDIAEDVVICRLCIKIPANDNYITLNKTSDEISHCRNMIEIQLPEIDLSVTEEPVICDACHTLLKNYVSFATNCIDVEQKIKMYCEHQRSVKEQLDLLHVLQFTENKAKDCENSFNGDLVVSHGESSVPVKIEKIEEVEKDNLSKDNFTYGGSTEFYIKEEEVQIKSEDDQIRMDVKQSERLDDSNSDFPKKKMIMENESKVKTNFCPKCSYSSKSIANIKRHLRSQSHSKIWTCHLCPFTANSHFSLKIHTRSHRGPSNMFCCTECPYKTHTKCDLVRHLLKHKDQSEVEMYNCPLCPYKSKYEASLRDHRKRRHDNNTIYQCKECSYSTKYKKSFLRHQLLLHKNPEEIKKFKCEKCEHEAKSKSGLAMHMLTHEEGKFKCEECPYRGKRPAEIKRHMIGHSEQSPFRCDQCTYSSYAKKYLLAHKRKIHADPKLILQCDQCGFFAQSNFSLYMHKNMHDPTKQLFKCEQCGYSTYHPSRLNQHLVTHKALEETVIYNCPTCDFKSKYKCSLTGHMKICSKKQEGMDSRVIL